MPARTAIVWGACFYGCLAGITAGAAEPAAAFTVEDERQVEAQLMSQRLALDARFAAAGPSLSLHSTRGDVAFFLGDFPAALADYDAMITFQPALRSEHWRRGLALYYVGQFAEGAEQFAACAQMDQSDRENGVWRYFCQRRQYDADRARAELLPYTRADRDPLPDVYALLQGKMPATDLTRRIEERKLAPNDHAAQMFYAELYLGMMDVIENRPTASAHLTRALNNPWPRTAGYGPRYMWHLARVQRRLLGVPEQTSSTTTK